MTTDKEYGKDKFVKKDFSFCKKIVMDLEMHLNKNYEGWE